MYRSSAQFLSCAGLARDKNARVGFGDQRKLLHLGDEGRALANKLSQPQFFLERVHRGCEAPSVPQQTPHSGEDVDGSQRRSDEIRVIDIALLPEFRRRGIGSSLMDQILDEAVKNNLPVTIHVERFNPALHFYQRLGFRLAEDKGIYYFMKWLPVSLEQHVR